jgi:hypothetical protein
MWRAVLVLSVVPFLVRLSALATALRASASPVAAELSTVCH